MTRRPDSFGVGLALGLVVALAGGGVVVVSSGLMTPSELLGLAVAGFALVAGYHPKRPPPAYRNTYAHGGARLADERETQAASGGANKAPELHDQTFEN
jgi:hypothetical protein